MFLWEPQYKLCKRAWEGVGFGVAVRHWFTNGAQPSGGFLEISGNDLGCPICEDTFGLLWVESGGISHCAMDDMNTQNKKLSCVLYDFEKSYWTFIWLENLHMIILQRN